MTRAGALQAQKLLCERLLLLLLSCRLPDELLSSGSVTVATVDPATNDLSNQIVRTLTGYGGTRDPVGVVVKSGVAFVANRDASCGIIRCTDAATMTGCSCALTSAQNAQNVRAITMSPDGSKLYFTSQTGLLGAFGLSYGVVTCALTGTTIDTCTVRNSNTVLSGIYATGSNVYVVARVVAVPNHVKVWVCDPLDPDPDTSQRTGHVFNAGLVGNDPWSVSLFNNMAYVPDNQNIRVCSSTNPVDSCTGTGLNTSPILNGASSIFILPRI
jgi:hypothetical protein